MNEAITEFIPYPCSLGIVVGHDENNTVYRVQNSVGQILGVKANTVCSPENVENDIANPPPRYATPEEIAAYRYSVEVGGVNVTINGETHKFDSRREMEARWVKLQLVASTNPNFQQFWKTMEGNFILLSSTDVLTVCSAIETHINACFVKEAQLLQNPPLLSELSSQNWPS